MAGLVQQERCKIITESDIDTIFSFFDNALNSEQLAEIESGELKFIKQNSEILKKKFAQFGVTFNELKFMKLVQSILGSMPPSQRGGANEEVDVRGKKSFVRYDLYAIVALLVSVFILFLAYLQLHQMSLDTTDRTPAQLTMDLGESIKETIASVPRGNLPLLSYVYNVFTDVCSNIGTNVSSFARSKATNVIYYTFDNFNAEAISICSTKQTGVLGMMDGMVKAIVNLGGTSECVINQQKRLFEMYTNEIANVAVTKATTQAMALQNIKSLVVAGLGLGAPAVGYLKYRLTSKSSQQLEMLDYDNRTLSRGGKKRSKSKKRSIKQSIKRSKSKKRSIKQSIKRSKSKKRK